MCHSCRLSKIKGDILSRAMHIWKWRISSKVIRCLCVVTFDVFFHRVSTKTSKCTLPSTLKFIELWYLTLTFIQTYEKIKESCKTQFSRNPELKRDSEIIYWRLFPSEKKARVIIKELVRILGLLLNSGLCVKAICWDCTSVFFNLQSWSLSMQHIIEINLKLS